MSALGTCGPSDARVARSAKRLTSGFGGKEDIVNRPKRTTRRNGGLQQRQFHNQAISTTEMFETGLVSLLARHV